MVSVDEVGVHAPVVTLTVPDGQLLPSVFTARNRIGYVVAEVNPVMISGLEVTAGEGVTQELPPFNEYS